MEKKLWQRYDFHQDPLIRSIQPPYDTPAQSTYDLSEINCCFQLKALMACKLYKAMAHEADQDDLEVDISDELRAYAK